MGGIDEEEFCRDGYGEIPIVDVRARGDFVGSISGAYHEIRRQCLIHQGRVTSSLRCRLPRQGAGTRMWLIVAAWAGTGQDRREQVGKKPSASIDGRLVWKSGTGRVTTGSRGNGKTKDHVTRSSERCEVRSSNNRLIVVERKQCLIYSGLCLERLPASRVYSDHQHQHQVHINMAFDMPSTTPAHPHPVPGSYPPAASGAAALRGASLCTRRRVDENHSRGPDRTTAALNGHWKTRRLAQGSEGSEASHHAERNVPSNAQQATSDRIVLDFDFGMW